MENQLKAKNKRDNVHLGRLNLEMIKEHTKGINSDLENQNTSDEDLKVWLENSKPYVEPDLFTLDEKNKTKDINQKVFNKNYLKLTFEQVKNLPTNDLYKLLSGENHSGSISDKTVQLISNEILSRQIKEASKPHWTITPTFIVATIAAIGTVISIYISLR